MNLKERYLKEIESQLQTKDTEILKWFLSIINTSSQWNAFTTVKWIDGKRIWCPTETLNQLSNGLQTNN